MHAPLSNEAAASASACGSASLFADKMLVLIDRRSMRARFGSGA